MVHIYESISRRYASKDWPKKSIRIEKKYPNPMSEAEIFSLLKGFQVYRSTRWANDRDREPVSR
jgi:hypothetical protein